MFIFSRLPLYLTFLVIVLTASLVVGWISYWLQLEKIESQVTQSELTRIGERLVQLQGTIDDFHRRGDDNAIHREIARLAVDPTLRLLVVVAPDGVVQFSSLIDLRGRHINELDEIDLAAVQAVIPSAFGGVHYDPETKRVAAIYPVVAGMSGSAVFQGARAKLVGIFDIQLPLDRAFYAHEQNIVQGVVLNIVMLLGAFLLLYSSIRIRMNRIVQTTRNFLSGDYASRVSLDGKDEFAQIGRTFDHMAGEIEIQHHNLRRLAHYDHLTDLPNRHNLIGRMERLIAQDGDTAFALCFIDLDRFKVVNDTLGHAVGDELLKVMASRIRGAVKEADSVARFGGDEFLLLLEGVSSREVLQPILTRLMTQLAKPVILEGQHLHVTVSIGIAIYPADGHTGQSLIQRADIAMYQAKRKGRNRYHFYHALSDELSPDQLNLEHHLKLALERGEVIPYFQPQYDAHCNRLVGFEALARMRGPAGEMLSPGIFLDMLEETGLMDAFDRVMYRRAITEFQAWLASHTPEPVPRLSLNVSPGQLDAEDFLRQVDELIEETGIEPQLLEFEITEGTLINAVDQKIDILQALQSRGIQVAIDDFGTGYSSLSYLKKLPIDRLKIDASFVRDINVDADDNAIIETIIAMAAKLGLEVVAEGVETQEQLMFLLRHQCNVAQGYLFGRPAPLAELRLIKPDGLKVLRSSP